MNCGYDPDPQLEYDTPPIAPQIWHAYHIAGEQLATGIIAALIHRHRSGQGQDVSVAVHEAVSKNPELDIMHWVMRRVPLWRHDQSACGGDAEPFAHHQPYQGWALVHLAWHGRARFEEPGAAAVEIRHAGRSAAATAGCRSESSPGAGFPGGRRDAGAYAGCGAAFHPRVDLCRHAVAGGARCRFVVGAAAQTARECARRTLAETEKLRRCASPGAWTQLPVPDQQVAQQPDKLAGRAAGTAAGRGHRAVLSEAARAAECAGTAARRGAAEAVGAAPETVPVAGREDTRFRVVPGVRGRHPFPCRRWAPRASRSNGRTIPIPGLRRWRLLAGEQRAMPRPDRCLA